MKKPRKQVIVSGGWLLWERVDAVIGELRAAYGAAGVCLSVSYRYPLGGQVLFADGKEGSA